MNNQCRQQKQQIAFYADQDTSPKAVRKALALLGDIEIAEQPEGYPLLFHLSADSLVLRSFNGQQEQTGQVTVDFLSPKNIFRLHQAKKKELLLKAIKIKNHLPGSVLDATGGLGRDGFLLAAAGCPMVICERDKYVAALLADGLQRAGSNEETREICSRIRLVFTDTKDYLKNPEETHEVIYIDPMFPERSKTAKVKQELALLQQLLKAREDDSELFAACWEHRPKKIVVKRPLKALPLCAVPPEYSLRGKAIRFDVYTPASMPMPVFPAAA